MGLLSPAKISINYHPNSQAFTCVIVGLHGSLARYDNPSKSIQGHVELETIQVDLCGAQELPGAMI